MGGKILVMCFLFQVILYGGEEHINKIPLKSRDDLVTQRFCYRGPKPQKFPKWLGEGAKCLLGQGRQRPLALVQKKSCTCAKQGFGGAKDSWETFAPWVQNTFAPSPNHFGHF